MSFDEVTVLIKSDNERSKRNLEIERMTWFYTVVAQQGTEKLKSPDELVRFEWEKKPTKQGKKLTDEQLKEKERIAKKWLKSNQ